MFVEFIDMMGLELVACRVLTGSFVYMTVMGCLLICFFLFPYRFDMKLNKKPRAVSSDVLKCALCVYTNANFIYRNFCDICILSVFSV